MKILLSPSKTMTPTTIPAWDHMDWVFPKQTKKLISTIRKLKKKDLKTALKLSDSLTTQTYHAYKDIYKAERHHAFPSFSGLVFMQLDVPSYTEEQRNYIMNHIRILDALFGVLHPNTSIPPYRLDMKASVGVNLYKYWNVNQEIEDDLIINLASKEFSKMVQKPMITIEFYQCKEGQCNTQATYSKIARGMMAHYMITKQVNTIDVIKQFDLDGYVFNPSLSTDTTIAFSRK